MKKMLLILLLILVVSACTIKNNIPFLPISDNSSYSEKIPARATFILKDESENYIKRVNDVGGITMEYITPSGKIMNGVARELLPQMFAQTSFEASAGGVKDGIIITADIVNNKPVIVIAFKDGAFKADLSMRVNILTADGHELYSSTAFSDAKPRIYNSFSSSAAFKAYGEQTYDAYRSALRKALGNMLNSYAVVEYLTGSGFKSEVKEAPKSAPVQVPSDMTDKEKLRYAFENGDISAEQLSRAINDLNSGSPSKILQSFISGTVDAKTFGDLY